MQRAFDHTTLLGGSGEILRIAPTSVPIICAMKEKDQAEKAASMNCAGMEVRRILTESPSFVHGYFCLEEHRLEHVASGYYQHIFRRPDYRPLLVFR